MHRERAVWAVGLCLVALQLPFVLTQHIQEDAYITFRSAENLADLHVYGFNPGERVSASTSHLSVFVVALLRTFTGDAFIPATQLLYGVATIVGLYFLTAAVVEDGPWQIRVWFVASLMPVSLMIGYGGMETGLLILLTGIIVRGITLGISGRWTGAAFVLLPWVRPDSIAIGTLVLVAAASARNISRRTVVLYASLMLFGVLSWTAFNRLYFGTFLTQTLNAKATIWSPSSLAEVVTIGAARLKGVLVNTPGDTALFLPLQTKYLRPLTVPALLVSLAGMGWLAARSSQYGARRVAVVALLLIACVPPIAYAAGGKIYPWYLWPSQLAVVVLLTALWAGWIARQSTPLRTIGAYAGIAMMCFLATGQWLLAVSWGTQERLYRGGIGERIRELSHTGDTLLLEPAGYVPFYAKLFTWDEIGLASPAVTQYRAQYGTHWWLRFVEDRSPTFLLERQPLPDGGTLDGYFLSADEKAFFDRHYRAVETFHYEPHSLRRSRVLGDIAAFGSASDYYLYQRIQ
jgi:hypothetical protein